MSEILKTTIDLFLSHWDTVSTTIPPINDVFPTPSFPVGKMVKYSDDSKNDDPRVVFKLKGLVVGTRFGPVKIELSTARLTSDNRPLQSENVFKIEFPPMVGEMESGSIVFLRAICRAIGSFNEVGIVADSIGDSNNIGDLIEIWAGAGTYSNADLRELTVDYLRGEEYIPKPGQFYESDVIGPRVTIEIDTVQATILNDFDVKIVLHLNDDKGNRYGSFSSSVESVHWNSFYETFQLDRIGKNLFTPGIKKPAKEKANGPTLIVSTQENYKKVPLASDPKIANDPVIEKPSVPEGMFHGLIVERDEFIKENLTTIHDYFNTFHPAPADWKEETSIWQRLHPNTTLVFIPEIDDSYGFVMVHDYHGRIPTPDDVLYRQYRYVSKMPKMMSNSDVADLQLAADRELNDLIDISLIKKTQK